MTDTSAAAGEVRSDQQQSHAPQGREFVVWRRSDGYVDASTYVPLDGPWGTFEILLTSPDWSKCRALIQAEREAHDRPA